MGRPRKTVTETDSNEESTEAAEVTVPRSRNEIAAGRPKRVPLFDQRDMMTVPTKPGYVRRWVNDVGIRVERFKLAGWTIVDDAEVQVGELGVTDNNVALGSGARKHVGRTRTTDNTYAVLMEIPEEWYREDQAAKMAKVDETEAEIRRKTREENFYGEFHQSTGLRKRRTSDD